MITNFIQLSDSARWVLMALAADYVAVVAAVTADFASGVSKARRAGLPRTSRGYRRTFDKLGRYLGSLAALTFVDTVIVAAVACMRVTGGPLLPVVPVLTSLGALAITLIEAKSISERLDQKDTDITHASHLLERIIKFLISKKFPA